MPNIDYKMKFYEEIRHFRFASVNLLIIFNEDLSPTKFNHRTAQTLNKSEPNETKKHFVFFAKLIVCLVCVFMEEEKYILEIYFCSVHEMHSFYSSSVRIMKPEIIFGFSSLELLMKMTKPMLHKVNQNKIAETF